MERQQQIGKDQQQQLTYPSVQNFLIDLWTWDKALTGAFGSLPLSPDLTRAYKSLLIEEYSRTNPRFLPLVEAQFEADPQLVVNSTSSIGKRMHASSASGIVHNHAIYFLRSLGDKIQTMGRVAVLENGKTILIDVFSDLINPGLIPTRSGGKTTNVVTAEISRHFNLLKYVEEKGAKVLGYVPLYDIPKKPSPDYLQEVNFKEYETTSATDVVVIRPARQVPTEAINHLSKQLTQEGFIPILLPYPSQEDEDLRYFPTDCFREVGNNILSISPVVLEDILEKLKQTRPWLDVDGIARKVNICMLPGGHYVYLASKGLFIYDDKFMRGRLALPPDGATDKFKVIEVNTHHTLLDKLGEPQDLDFLLSLFEGKDGRAHALVASSFVPRLPNIDLISHVIPDSEALNGGCNVADLRHGSILISPNRNDAPTTYSVLQQHAKAKLIEAPKGFLDDGGGLRCSISSFSIT